MRLSFAGLLLLATFSAPRAAQAQTLDPRLALPRLELRRIDLAAPGPASSASRILAPGEAERGRVATGWLAVGGFAGGILGMAAGLGIGGLVDGRTEADCMVYCLGATAAMGAIVGEVVGVAAGVHLANGRKGSLLLDVAASTGVLAVSLLVAPGAPVIFFLFPVNQVIGSIMAERAVERR